MAHAAGIPVVGDLECLPPAERFAELLALADHLVISLDFAQGWTGCEHRGRRGPGPMERPEAGGCRDLRGGRMLVHWCGRDPQTPQHQPAMRVAVVDTTGCGDVFHGAYAAGLARGLELPERIRLASAAAALKATRPGGQAGIPTRAAIDRFLEEYRE